jgi:hypothetical protein
MMASGSIKGKKAEGVNHKERRYFFTKLPQVLHSVGLGFRDSSILIAFYSAHRQLKR